MHDGALRRLAAFIAEVDLQAIGQALLPVERPSEVASGLEGFEQFIAHGAVYLAIVADINEFKNPNQIASAQFVPAHLYCPLVPKGFFISFFQILFVCKKIRKAYPKVVLWLIGPSRAYLIALEQVVAVELEVGAISKRLLLACTWRLW